MSQIIEGEAVEVKTEEVANANPANPANPNTRIEVAVKFGDVPTVFNVAFDIPNELLGFGLHRNIEFITSKIAQVMNQPQVHNEIVKIFTADIDAAKEAETAEQPKGDN